MENILITGADGQLGSELRGLTKGDSGTKLTPRPWKTT